MPKYITPGQALLKLIEYYKLNPIKSQSFQRLFLTGGIDAERQIRLCDAMLDEKIMQGLDLTINEHDISKDPVRRYFETHLTYYTLRNNLNKLSTDDLQDLYMKVRGLLSESQPIPEHAQETINSVIRGTCGVPSFLRSINWEFNDFFRNIAEDKIFQEFSSEETAKAYWLMATIYICLVTVWFQVPNKITAYETNSLFTDKGKIKVSRDERRSNSRCRSQNYGLLKGHMPVMGINDIAFAKTPFRHWKPSDYNTFNDDSPSAQFIFEKLTHPFSNGVSGVCLMVIKTLSKLNDNGVKSNITSSTEKFKLFMQMAISCRGFVGGGHSLFEYTAVLSIPEIAEAMQFVPEYDSISLESLFYDDNQAAFTQAIDNTLEYMHMLEHRETLHAELSHKQRFFFSRSKNSSSPSYVGDIKALEPDDEQRLKIK